MFDKTYYVPGILASAVKYIYIFFSHIFQRNIISSSKQIDFMLVLCIKYSIVVDNGILP